MTALGTKTPNADPTATGKAMAGSIAAPANIAAIPVLSEVAAATDKAFSLRFFLTSAAAALKAPLNLALFFIFISSVYRVSGQIAVSAGNASVACSSALLCSGGATSAVKPANGAATAGMETQAIIAAANKFLNRGLCIRTPSLFSSLQFERFSDRDISLQDSRPLDTTLFQPGRFRLRQRDRMEFRAQRFDP
ncbi:MAG: hypothetical protein GC185_06765 [Alphaproteobacteria bacterium]|nr:hypothetical protein [Alphaproteobacteria bacterium]